MIQRFRWFFLAMLVGGAILWVLLPRSRQKDESTVAQPRENKERESSRHQTGEIKKNPATPLEKKVAEQERVVEKHKNELLAYLKARNPIPSQMDGAPPPEPPPEEVAKRTQAAQDFEDARQEYTADRQLLQELKLELAEEQARGKKDAESH